MTSRSWSASPPFEIEQAHDARAGRDSSDRSSDRAGSERSGRGQDTDRPVLPDSVDGALGGDSGSCRERGAQRAARSSSRNACAVLQGMTAKSASASRSALLTRVSTGDSVLPREAPVVRSGVAGDRRHDPRGIVLVYGRAIRMLSRPPRAGALSNSI